MPAAFAPWVLAASLVSLQPAPEPPPPTGAPGGYWTLGEQRERQREPLDGDEALTLGSILLSLGLIRAGAGVVHIWMAGRPDLCPLETEADCGGLRVYGWVGVGEGGLLATTGIVYMAIGAVRRDRHRRWERGEAVALRPRRRTARLLDQVDLAPYLTPTPQPVPGQSPSRGRWSGGGLQLRLRF